VPELPEVETMVRGIRPFVENRRISAVIPCPTHCQPISVVPPLKQFGKALVGQTVTAVRRLGKRVVLDLANATSVVVEPRMTGLMLLADPPDVEHLRVEWQFDGERDFNSVWFWDRRGLGTIRLYQPGELDQVYGPDTLGPDALTLTSKDWRVRLGATTRAVKVALLDQKLAAGIGNLYASEILHVAGIDPQRSGKSLSKSQVDKLSQAVRDVLARAIETEGSTLGDGTYRNALSQSGRYQNEHRVYMRADQTCPTCQRGVIVRLVQAQRSTFYCPRCQR
jgi:formamidopyrimidine-DNA glycosylase